MNISKLSSAIVLATSIAFSRPIQPTAETCNCFVTGNCSASWVGPFDGSCTIPTICPQGDKPAVVSVTVRDQFGVPCSGVPASSVEAAGSCALFAGSPCSQVISIQADGPTDGLGKTTITVDKAGGCCTDLQIRATGATVAVLSYKSFDYNGDRAVNLSDQGFLADTYGKCSGQAGFNSCFDFNCDGCVNLSDLGAFSSHFNHTCL